MPNAQTVDISEPTILIRISQRYSPQLSSEALYEAVRGVWVVGERREKIHYALAVADGHVQEVYKVDSWHPAGTTKYNTRSQSDVEVKGRWEFVGSVAADDIRNKYIDQSVAHYFAKGAANPVLYLNT